MVLISLLIASLLRGSLGGNMQYQQSPNPDYGYSNYANYKAPDAYVPKGHSYDDDGYDAYGRQKGYKAYDDGYDPNSAKYADYNPGGNDYGYNTNIIDAGHKSTINQVYNNLDHVAGEHRNIPPVTGGLHQVGYGGIGLVNLPDDALEYATQRGNDREEVTTDLERKQKHHHIYAAGSGEINVEGYNQKVDYGGNSVWEDENGFARGYDKGEGYGSNNFDAYNKFSSHEGNAIYIEHANTKDVNLNYEVNHALEYKNKFKDENHQGSYKGNEFDIAYKAQDVNGGYYGKETEGQYMGQAYDGAKNNGGARRTGKYHGNDYIDYGTYSKEAEFSKTPKTNPMKNKDGKYMTGQKRDNAYARDKLYGKGMDSKPDNGYGKESKDYYEVDPLYAKFKSKKHYRPRGKKKSMGPTSRKDDSVSDFKSGRYLRHDPHSASSDQKDFTMKKRKEKAYIVKDSKGKIYEKNPYNYGKGKTYVGMDGAKIVYKDVDGPSNDYWKGGSFSDDGSYRAYGAGYEGRDYWGKNHMNEAEAGATEKTSNKVAWDKGDYRAVDAKGHNRAAQYQGDYQTNNKEHQLVFNVKHDENIHNDVKTDVKLDQYRAGFSGKDAKTAFQGDFKQGSYYDKEYQKEADKNAHFKDYEGESFANGFSGEAAGIYYSGAIGEATKTRTHRVEPDPNESEERRSSRRKRYRPGNNVKYGHGGKGGYAGHGGQSGYGGHAGYGKKRRSRPNPKRYNRYSGHRRLLFSDEINYNSNISMTTYIFSLVLCGLIVSTITLVCYKFMSRKKKQHEAILDTEVLIN